MKFLSLLPALSIAWMAVSTHYSHAANANDPQVEPLAKGDVVQEVGGKFPEEQPLYERKDVDPSEKEPPFERRIIEPLEAVYPEPECEKLEHSRLFRTRKQIVGVSVYPSRTVPRDLDVLFAFKDGSAIQVPSSDLNNLKDKRQRHVKKFLLAPAYGDRESCDTSSLEDVEFSTMAVSMCPGHMDIKRTGLVNLKAKSHFGKTFFAYHKKGDDFPSASYALRGPGSKWFCQVFPTTPHPLTTAYSTSFAQPSSSSMSMLNNYYGNLIFMVDYDNNDILVQVGTTKEDCDNPLVRRHFHKKITAFASCCLLPIVFVGFENGDVAIYVFKTQGHGCRGKLVCLSIIPAPCGCGCCSPVPVGIQLCCDELKMHNDIRAKLASGEVSGEQIARILSIGGVTGLGVQATILYRGVGCSGKKNAVKTVLKTIDFGLVATLSSEREIEYNIFYSHGYDPIVNSEIVDFRVCCGSHDSFVFIIVKDCSGQLYLLHYSILHNKFLAKRRLPCHATIKSWTLVPNFRAYFPCKENLSRVIQVPKDLYGCCALFVFDAPPPCTDCDPCPPKSLVVRYCCNCNRYLK
jgi:hypothetical protein